MSQFVSCHHATAGLSMGSDSGIVRHGDGMSDCTQPSPALVTPTGATPDPASTAEPSRPAGARPTSWTGRTRGGYFGNWFFVQLIRVVGLRAAYVWLVLIAAYYTLTSPRAFRSSVDYFRRLEGPRRFWVWPVRVYRHFYSFGVTLLDRIAVIMGRSRMECVFEGEEVFQELLRQGQGFILVGAHLGNWEMAAHLLGRFGKPINLIVLEREEGHIRRLFDHALHARQFRILTADANPLRTIPILAALRRGEVVGMLGDRSFGGAEVAVPFLGGAARFPVGPYHLAAVTGVPLFHVFAVRERLGAYRFFSFPALRVSREALRGGTGAVEALAAEYARRLESVARQYPYQWHNFYPFWDPPVAGPEGGSPVASPP